LLTSSCAWSARIVDPTQAVVGGEEVGWQVGQNLLQGQLVLRGERHLQERIVGPEDFRQHPGSASGSEGPSIGGRGLFCAEFLAIL